MKDQIKAEYACDSEPERRDGTDILICPACKKRVKERDVEPYYEEGSDRAVQLCGACREDFEFDEECSLDADVLDAGTFERLWKWMKESAPVAE